MAGKARAVADFTHAKNQDGELVKASADIEDDRIKPLENVLSFLSRNSLADNLSSSVLYQVHEDLRLVRKWTNMRVVKGAKRTYLVGSAAHAYDSVFPGASQDVDRTQIVVPIAKSEMLSPRILNGICEDCRHPETGETLRCVTVAIVDDDSTTAYYRIFNKWEEIVHPQWKQKKKRAGVEDVENGEEGRDVDTKTGSGSESAGFVSDSE